MIRAIRPSAMAQDDAAMISGWNISPNLAYTLLLTPGASACGVLLFDADMSVLIASGAALVGTAQPCVLVPQSGTIGMVDADLGWHLLITTEGAESERMIRIGPAVDLPDEIHPIYGEDAIALVRAKAGVDGAAHYIDDLTVTCPLGLGAGIGSVASAPVDGVAVVGQVESITWSGTPSGATEQAVVRRHVAIAPAPHVDPVPITPPTVEDDEAETDAETEASGNVLANDETGLTIVAVNGLVANVGEPVAGSNGGVFLIDEDGSWTFDPDSDFAALAGAETAETSVTYHVSDGVSEAMAALTVTVSSGAAVPWTLAEITTDFWLDPHTSACRNIISGKIYELYDNAENGKVIRQATEASRPSLVANALNGLDIADYDGSNDYLRNSSMPFSQPVTYVAVCRVDSAANNPALIDGAASARNLTGFNAGRNLVMHAGSTLVSSATITLGEWAIIATHFDGESSWGRLNGEQVISGNAGSSNVTGIAIGNDYNGGNPLNGAHGVIAVIPGSNVLETVQKAEGRIAHDYNLASLLPSDHPYKSAPPTV